MPSRDQVNWRPGRIQSINGEQEIILKQVWAYYLKYWGYDVRIPDEDLAYKDCFVASTSTVEFGARGSVDGNGLTRSTTRNSIGSTTSHKTSTSTLMSKKKRGLFGGGKKAAATTAPATPPPDSKRMKQIQTKSSSERYSQVTEPSENVYSAFHAHYKQTFDFADDYQSSEDEYDEDDDSDNASMETFVTASTSLTDPEDLSFSPPIPKGGSPYTKKGITHPAAKNGYVSHGSSNGYANGYSNGYANGHTKSISRSKSTKSQTLPPPPQPTQSYSKAAPQKKVARAPRHHVSIHPNPGILSILAKYKPADLHKALFSSCRNDLLDNFVLRFVRARKWNTENAISMLSKSLNWRIVDMSPDAWTNEGDAYSYVHGVNKGLVKNFTTEKSWIRGHDLNGNPLFFFQARKHFGSDSPVPETQRYAVLTIEWCRLFLRDQNESVDQVSVVFDLTGFSLKNADYDAIKFLADVFEAHYPECLGCILIYNAPWIFSTVWNLIKNWLDPVVASKIHFTKNYKELIEFVDPLYIPQDFGGKDNTLPGYPIPEESDTHPPRRRDATFRRLRRERDDYFMKFLDTTIRWIESTNPVVSDKYLQDKMEIEYKISNNYLALDPYVRCSGIYDRDGTMDLRN